MPSARAPTHGPLRAPDGLDPAIPVDVAGVRRSASSAGYHRRHGTQRHLAAVTLKEAAALLGVRPDTLRQALHADPPRLNAEKIGRDWHVTPREVERYRAEQLGKKGRKRLTIRRRP